jgi:hypothetical protein
MRSAGIPVAFAATALISSSVFRSTPQLSMMHRTIFVLPSSSTNDRTYSGRLIRSAVRL